MVNLPKPNKGSIDRVETMTPIVGAIVDLAGASGLGSLSAAVVNAAIKRRLNNANATLQAEMRAGNLSLLDNPSLEEWIPSAYRFFESARIGSSNAKLQLLAKMLVGTAAVGKLDSDEFSVICSKLERIDNESLDTLYLLKKSIDLPLFGNDIKFPERITIHSHMILSRFNVDRFKLTAGLSELANAGIIILVVDANVSGSSDTYLDTKWLHAIFRYALGAQEDSECPRP